MLKVVCLDKTSFHMMTPVNNLDLFFHYARLPSSQYSHQKWRRGQLDSSTIWRQDILATIANLLWVSLRGRDWEWSSRHRCRYFQTWTYCIGTRTLSGLPRRWIMRGSRVADNRLVLFWCTGPILAPSRRHYRSRTVGGGFELFSANWLSSQIMVAWNLRIRIDHDNS
jgi:hypothetical protein